MKNPIRRLALFLVALIAITATFGTTKAAPETQPAQNKSVVWTDYTSTTTPQRVAPMGLVTHTLTAKQVHPTGPYRLWSAFPQDMNVDDLAAVIELVAKDNPSLEVAGYQFGEHEGTLVCELSSAPEFIECLRNLSPHIPGDGEPDMAMALEQVVSGPLQQARNNDENYDGVDYVYLSGRYSRQDLVPTDLRRCFENREDVGTKSPTDRLLCQTLIMHLYPRIALITQCQRGKECSEARMSALTGFQHQISQTDPAEIARALSRAIYLEDPVPQQSQVVAHVLTEFVVPESLPDNCMLTQGVIACSVGFNTEFTLSYQARPRPMNWGMWSPPPPWSLTSFWQIARNTPYYKCPGDTLSFVMTAVQLDLGNNFHQVYLPATQRGCVGMTGCNEGIDNINEPMCPQRPVAANN